MQGFRQALRKAGHRTHRSLFALWRLARVVWVCRISLLSAVVGGCLFLLTAQGLDLFSDLGLSLAEWAFFFGCVFVWACIVHIVARRALQNDCWVPEAHCPGGIRPARRRRLQWRYRRPALWVPRLLGLSVFGFLLLAIQDAVANLSPVRLGLGEAADAVVLIERLQWATLAIACLYVVFIWTRRNVSERVVSGGHQLAASEPPLLIGLRPFPHSISHRRAGAAAPTRLLVAGRALFGLIGLAITASFFVALLWPHAMAETLPRAMLVPLLFGGVVLILGELVLWSYVWRTPVVFLLVVAGVACHIFVGHYHDVRWVARARPNFLTGAESQQISMREAVDRWQAANECGPLHEGKSCPRPIIIAGAGGASRAAFLTATTVGALIDAGRQNGEFGDVRKRIFAMSTVSGSSVGAIVIRAALTDALESGRPSDPPCVKGTSQRAWFRSINPKDDAFAAAADITKSWRDCLQLLLSGDFLSPVMVGLVYRDQFPMPFLEDRATLLEQALERRYRDVTTTEGPRSCRERDHKGLCRRFGFHPDPRVTDGTWVPLLFINGTSVATGRRIVVGDVPASDVYRKKEGGDDELMLLPQAYGLEEIRSWISPVGELDSHERHSAIRLSTAATMSARFPVISPHGNLRDRTGDILDRIVDGGYFENDGLATAADVASALKYFGLEPVVIRVVNEPESQGNKFKFGRGRPAVPDEDDSSQLDAFTSVVRALTATRSGHEDGHQAYLEGVLGADARDGRPAVPGADRLYEVRVYPLRTTPARSSADQTVANPSETPFCRRTIHNDSYMRRVSMSWWISQPVQAYLDAQLCVRANWARIECELREGALGGDGGDCRNAANDPQVAARTR